MALVQAARSHRLELSTLRPVPGDRLAEPSVVPWWLWPNLLSLDAPVVCALWAVLFARAYSLRLSWPDLAALFGSVWVIYASDRLLDAWRCTNIGQLRRRHFFAACHRIPFVTLVAVVGPAVIAVALLRLRAAEIMMGLGLSLLVLTYLFWVHWCSRRAPRQLPKELAVGTLFAMGTTLPSWSARGFPALFLPVSLFAGLCSLNCLAVDRWEGRETPTASTPESQRNRRSGPQRQSAKGFVLACVAVALLAATTGGSTWPISCGIVSSALLLALIQRNRRRLSPEQLRVLADMALALPAAAAVLATSW